MDVAILEPQVRAADSRNGRLPAQAAVAHVAEWIDPEGDDWYAEIYRELALAADSQTVCDDAAPELANWFG